jgi:hypothetical protein
MICEAKTHYRETDYSPAGRETQGHSEKCTMGVTTARKTNLKCNWTAAAADSSVGCTERERERERSSRESRRDAAACTRHIPETAVLI